MSDSTLETTNHDEIRQWAESRNAKPSQTGSSGIELNFPGYKEDGLKEISWDEWFKEFDDRGLKLLYQEKTADGEESNFHKLVSR